MTEENTTQAQQSAFTNPFLSAPFAAQWTKAFAAPTQVQNAWVDAMTQSMSRVSDFWTEVARMETAGVERVSAGIDEWAKLAKEGLHYQLQLQAEMRRLASEATQQLTQFKRDAN